MNTKGKRKITSKSDSYQRDQDDVVVSSYSQAMAIPQTEDNVNNSRLTAFVDHQKSTANSSEEPIGIFEQEPKRSWASCGEPLLDDYDNNYSINNNTSIPTKPKLNTNTVCKDNTYEEPWFASIMRCIGCCFGYTAIACCFGGCCGSCCYPYQTIQQGNKGVIQEFGRVKRQVDSGLHYVNPMTEQLSQVNMRQMVINLDKQHIMTADNLSVTIDSVVYYQVTDIETVLFKINNLDLSIIEMSYATLRNVVGKFPLQQCLSERAKLATQIKNIIEENVAGWGIQIQSLQIKDITVPQNITQALSATAVAERESQAKLINARADVTAAKMLREAADILNTDGAMQIRHLEVLSKIAHSPNTKILMMPTDSMQATTKVMAANLATNQ